MKPHRRQRTYDHRLALLVQGTRDPTIATQLDVPRSTVARWLRGVPRPVTAARGGDALLADLRLRVGRLENRCQRLSHTVAGFSAGRLLFFAPGPTAPCAWSTS